jgi:hypothetical protein
MSGTGSNNSGGWRFEPTAQTKKQEKFLLDRFFVLIVGKLIFAAGIILVIATQANGNLIGHKVNMGAFVFGIILFVLCILCTSTLSLQLLTSSGSQQQLVALPSRFQDPFHYLL